MAAATASPKLVLCVPGPWSSRGELLERVVRDTGDHLFAGGVIMHIDSRFACELDFEERADPAMAHAFSLSGVTDDGLSGASIASHRSVAYLIGEGGSRAAAEAMMRSAAALVKAGGLGVKVESSGISHTAKKWLALVADQADGAAHEALVVYVAGRELRSCGMHLLGLPEAAVDAKAPGATVDLLKIYTRYLFEESPTIREDQTFSTELTAPVFRLNFEAGHDYGADSLFNNPFGMWRLRPADEAPAPAGFGQRLFDGLRTRWLH